MSMVSVCPCLDWVVRRGLRVLVSVIVGLNSGVKVDLLHRFSHCLSNCLLGRLMNGFVNGVVGEPFRTIRRLTVVGSSALDDCGILALGPFGNGAIMGNDRGVEICKELACVDVDIDELVLEESPIFVVGMDSIRYIRLEEAAVVEVINGGSRSVLKVARVPGLRHGVAFGGVIIRGGFVRSIALGKSPVDLIECGLAGIFRNDQCSI